MLLLRVVAAFALVLALVMGAVFFAAGTIHYWQGWAYVVALSLPAAAMYGYFLRNDPAVVERRLRQREREPEQRLIMRIGKPLFLMVFILPSLDYRLGWSGHLWGAEPMWLMLLALALVFAGMASTGWVIWVNRYAGRTIRVEQGQTVISTGPYALVRHPMYTASLAVWLFTPLALGSYVTLPVFALLLPVYVLRIRNEEAVLRRELAGYAEYCERTRYRLFPVVW